MRDFRSTSSWLASSLTVALLLTVAGCGGSETENAAAPSSGAQTLGLGSGDSDGGAVEQARADARAATEAAGTANPLANLKADSAAEALSSYLTACAAGDFLRASEFCHPDAPGTAKLISTGEGFERAMNDPQAQGMDIRGFLTQGFDQATTEVLEEGENRWAFEVQIPGKTPVRMEVVKLDQGWRVIPPDKTGLPAE